MKTYLSKALKSIFTVALCSCMFAANAQQSSILTVQKEISFEEFIKRTEPLEEQYKKFTENKDYPAIEKLFNETIASFFCMPKEIQKDNQQISGSLYYNLACNLSLQNKKNEAVDAFQKAIEYGWNNYLHAKNDTDLDNIRTDERFIALMESIREQGDYQHNLRQAGKYQRSDTVGLPRFTYEEATSENLIEVRKFFGLDSIAGQGDEISKILNLMKWVHDNIRHDGSNYALCEFDAIDIYNYYKSTGKGVNCRHLAIALNEIYLAMGFKSRYVMGAPEKDGKDSHVINCVFSNTLKKWLWMDPTMNAYWKDEKGNLLSIAEVRERYISDQPLILNEDANWNNQNKQTKENYLDGWMSKYLYWFECVAESRFNPESRYRNTNQTYIRLCPLGYEPYSSRSKQVITHDEVYFWEH